MARQLGSLAIGAKIKLGTIYGKKIAWKISDKNHAGYPANSVSLITEKIIKIMAFDAKEAESGDTNRKAVGNNRYLYSNLLQWLNKDNASGWYAAEHGTDAPPTKVNCLGYNGYDNIPGFLNAWTANEKAALLNTTVTVNKPTVDGGEQENVTRKIFLLSCKEVNLTGNIAEGSIHPLFSDEASRVAQPTADAVANSDYTISGLNTTSGWYWWLRSPYVSVSQDARGVSYDGELSGSSVGYGYWGLRKRNWSATQPMGTDAIRWCLTSRL
jgi:hypothetical protein